MGTTVRVAGEDDFAQIIGLDSAESGQDRQDYWHGLFNRFRNRPDDRHILVAIRDESLVGYIIGEVRDGEFGLPRAGWIVHLRVSDQMREEKVGTRLFDTLCARFRRDGVARLRTAVARTDTLVMAFFRSQGMMAAPTVQMEMDLDDRDQRGAS